MEHEEQSARAPDDVVEAFVESRAHQMSMSLRQKGTLQRLGSSRRANMPFDRDSEGGQENSKQPGGQRLRRSLARGRDAIKQLRFRKSQSYGKETVMRAATAPGGVMRFSWRKPLPRLRIESDLTESETSEEDVPIEDFTEEGFGSYRHAFPDHNKLPPQEVMHRSRGSSDLTALNDEIWRMLGKSLPRSSSCPLEEQAECPSLQDTSRPEPRHRSSWVLSMKKYATMRPQLRINGGRKKFMDDDELHQVGDFKTRFEAYMQGDRPNKWRRVYVNVQTLGLVINDINDESTALVHLFFEELVLPTGSPVDVWTLETSTRHWPFCLHTESSLYILGSASEAERELHMEIINGAYEEYIETQIRRRAMMQVAWQISSDDGLDSFALKNVPISPGPIFEQMKFALLDKFDEDMCELTYVYTLRKALWGWSALARYTKATLKN